MASNISPYQHDEATHNTSAAELVVPLVRQYITAQSVIDVGCGLGTWLQVFQEQGASEILGVDGDWVERALLCIPEEKFVIADLTKPFRRTKRYDLVVSLEVAEHLPASAAATFVATLVGLGDTILFSAAIPQQGGQNHLNEQWPTYWAELFAAHGYQFFDVLRPALWEMSALEFWYKQNIFLVSKQSFVQQHSSLNLVHPELLALKIQQYENLKNGKAGIQHALSIFLKTLRHSTQRFLGRNKTDRS